MSDNRKGPIDLLVLSRAEALNYIPVHQTAYISISTPGWPPAEFKDLSTIAGVLKLEFSDTNPSKDIGGGIMVSGADSMTSEHGMKLAVFVRGMMDAGVDHFMIHCDAGISRSPGVAAALDYVFNDARTLRPRYCCMNSWVYGRTLEAFMGKMCEGQSE